MNFTEDQLLVMEHIARKDLEFGFIAKPPFSREGQYQVITFKNVLSMLEIDNGCRISPYQMQDIFGVDEIICPVPHIGDCLDWIEKNIPNWHIRNISPRELVIMEILEFYKNKREDLFHPYNKEAFDYILELIKE